MVVLIIYVETLILYHNLLFFGFYVPFLNSILNDLFLFSFFLSYSSRFSLNLINSLGLEFFLAFKNSPLVFRPMDRDLSHFLSSKEELKFRKYQNIVSFPNFLNTDHILIPNW